MEGEVRERGRDQIFISFCFRSTKGKERGVRVEERSDRAEGLLVMWVGRVRGRERYVM